MRTIVGRRRQLLNFKVTAFRFNFSQFFPILGFEQNHRPSAAADEMNGACILAFGLEKKLCSFVPKFFMFSVAMFLHAKICNMERKNE
jgi:hypothetical protein